MNTGLVWGGADPSRAGALLAGQNRALELIATGASLEAVLEFLTRFIEDQSEGARCSVLIMRKDRLHHGIAPNLPSAYVDALAGGIVVGAGVGSCGHAAATGDLTIAEDISTHPYWTQFRHVVLPLGLRACWSIPIKSPASEVLGTFAIYNPDPHRPSDFELRLLQVAAHIAGIAMNRHLSDEALVERARALEESDKRKDVFLAMLAHELRNPLASVLYAVDLIHRQPDVPAPIGDVCNIVERQSRHLARLVDDLLDVSRLTRGVFLLHREPIEAGLVVRQALESLRPTLEARDLVVELDLAEAISLDADPVRLTQVMVNLLGNCAKFSNAGGRISVSMRRVGPEAVIKLCDNGIGMPPEVVERVFDLFMQADRSLDRPEGGLGIGLTLVRQIIELHGGSVLASSPGLGHGSEFVVKLPMAPTPPDREARADLHGSASPAHGNLQARAPGHGLRILVVDDNLDGSELLGSVLESEGHEVRLASDGPTALQIAEDFLPDVVLLDIGLPGMDGFEVARRLRAARPEDPGRIIAVTGYGQASDRQKAAEAGFDNLLVKPIDLDALLATLSSGSGVNDLPARARL